MAESEGTPLRRALTVETELDLKSVLGFYRQELGKRGWKEEATGAAVADDGATLNFTSPDGPAVLKLERKDDKTNVSLVVSNQAKAKASGQMAKPGKVKAMFGNLLGTPVTFTINKQTVKVAARRRRQRAGRSDARIARRHVQADDEGRRPARRHPGRHHRRRRNLGLHGRPRRTHADADPLRARGSALPRLPLPRPFAVGDWGEGRGAS